MKWIFYETNRPLQNSPQTDSLSLNQQSFSRKKIKHIRQKQSPLKWHLLFISPNQAKNPNKKRNAKRNPERATFTVTNPRV